jgi:hypothetical protein
VEIQEKWGLQLADARALKNIVSFTFETRVQARQCHWATSPGFFYDRRIPVSALIEPLIPLIQLICPYASRTLCSSRRLRTLASHES